VFSAKIGGEQEQHMENVSHIRFSIPFVLPACHVKTPREISADKLKEHRQQWERHNIHSEIQSQQDT